MNKQALAEGVKKRLGCSTTVARQAVEAVLDELVTGIIEEGSVALTGLGTFQVVTTSPRMARNPQTGEKVKVDPKNRVRFRPGQNLSDMANGLTDLGEHPSRKAPKGTYTGGKTGE